MSARAHILSGFGSYTQQTEPLAAAIKGETMGSKSLERQALDTMGKNWGKSSDTRLKLLHNVAQFTLFVQNRYHLEKLGNLKPGMIAAYASAMITQGLAPATMANRMTAVREVCAAIGKQGICSRENKTYGIERDRINPQQVNQGKLDEIRATLRDRASTGDRVATMMLAADSLRGAFGLRAKESLLSKDVTEKAGKLLLVVEGAKGGRPRELEVRTKEQLKAVQLVAETAKVLGSGTGRIIPPEMSLRQAYDTQRNEWRALGGTRASSANMHGERHAHARGMAADGATRGEIMLDLGHGEDRSPASYGV